MPSLDSTESNKIFTLIYGTIIMQSKFTCVKLLSTLGVFMAVQDVILVFTLQNSNYFYNHIAI